MSILDEFVEIPQYLGDFAADNNAAVYELYLVPLGKFLYVDHVYVASKVAVSAADTDYNTLTVRNNSTSAAAIAVLANGPVSGGTTIPQTGVEFPTYTAANRKVGSASAATKIYLTTAKTGSTGLAITGVRIIILGRWVPN
jgi:hypothetical protein